MKRLILLIIALVITLTVVFCKAPARGQKGNTGERKTTINAPV
jgi:hypothetical protein